MIDVTVKYYIPQNYKSSGRVVNFQILVADRLKYYRIWSLHITVTECWTPNWPPPNTAATGTGWRTSARRSSAGAWSRGTWRAGGWACPWSGWSSSCPGRGCRAWSGRAPPPRKMDSCTQEIRIISTELWCENMSEGVYERGIYWFLENVTICLFLISCRDSQATYFDFVLFLAGWIHAMNFHNARKINTI